MVHIAGVTTEGPERRGPQTELKGRRAVKNESFDAVDLSSDLKDIAMAIESNDESFLQDALENGGINKLIESIGGKSGSMNDVALENVIISMAKTNYDLSDINSEHINLIENAIKQLQPEAVSGGEFEQYADEFEVLLDKCAKLRDAELDKVKDILGAKSEAAKATKPSLSEILMKANALGFLELSGLTEDKVNEIKVSNEQLSQQISDLQKSSRGFGQRIFGLFGGGVKAKISSLEQQLAKNNGIISAVERLKDAYVDAKAPASTQRPRSTRSDDVRNRNTPKQTGRGTMAA